MVKRIDYDSFGNIIVDTNEAFKIPFGFAGGLCDRDAGLVRFDFRDYDPEVGRWTAKDPILFAGGDTDLYEYCMFDPVNWIDQDGLLKSGKLIAGIGTGVAGIITAVGGVAITYALLTGEAALAVPSGGASLLFTIHSVALGGTITATGGIILKIGLDMIRDALIEESFPEKVEDSCEKKRFYVSKNN